MPPLCKSQRGQSMVFVVLTLAVVLASGLLLFNSGMLATKKMQVQNAADAAAYSIALLEARDLNFMAYTNRALVANEVGIGQMVGLVSWAWYMESVPRFLDFWLRPLMGVPILGAILRVIITGLRILGRVVSNVVPRAADVFAKALGKMSLIYSNSQYIMHAATAGMSWGVYRDMIQANAPGARPSTYGTLALLAHQGSFYGKYLKRYSQKKTKPDQIAGMERLAQVIQDSRDPFLEKRRCGGAFSFMCENASNRNGAHGGWSLPLIPRISLNQIHSVHIPGVGTGRFGVSFRVSLDMSRRGGTELRQVQRGSQRLYAWSAADASGLVLDYRFRICVWNCWGRGDRLGAPLGLGAASAGSMQGGLLRGQGNVPDDRYGHGRGDLGPMIWEWPGYPGQSLSSQTRSHKVGGNYAGLPDYYGLPGVGDDYYGAGFMAPYLIVGVVLDADGVPKPQTRGRLDMPRHLAGPDGGQVAAIAKARVSFHRPRDLASFVRSDGAVEQANAFNPYWSAHLVDTLFADRVMALAVQQEERWYPQINLPDIPGIDYDAIANSLGIR